ncbi:MAG TPA: efflux RND transporter periplasmic adaptor subunit [Candidatus Binataceae bacterium]|jgi:RND family efflux transporter MFP subunit|nr:efflux RND transporter periplasmic adaptor subunit [Candidatus Binataceae bacterium]
MRRPSLLAIFLAGVVLGVVATAAVLAGWRRSADAPQTPAAQSAPAALPAPRRPPAAPSEEFVPAAHVAPAAAPAVARAGVASDAGSGAAAAARSGEIRIDPAMLQDLGVRTTLVEPRVVTESIHTTGYVDYDQRLVSQVNARVSGWVEKLHVAYAGQPVHRGETLLEIYSPELVLTQEDYLRARQLADTHAGGDSDNKARNDGSSLMSAAETRLRLWGIAPAELRKLARRGKPSETLPIESPASGVVTESKVVEGAHVRAGDELYNIADLSRVWVYADIYERELPKVHAGQQAEVSLDALPGQRFDGIVTYIYPSVSEQSRTVRVRLEFTNPGLVLRPGMYVKVTLLHRAPQPTLAVPAEAVLDSGVRKIVIVATGEGRFQPREIKTGTQSEGYFQVLGGLRQGERVVTSAQFLIDSESNLSEALSAMTLTPEGGAGLPAAGAPRPAGAATPAERGGR